MRRAVGSAALSAIAGVLSAALVIVAGGVSAPQVVQGLAPAPVAVVASGSGAPLVVQPAAAPIAIAASGIGTPSVVQPTVAQVAVAAGGVSSPTVIQPASAAVDVEASGVSSPLVVQPATAAIAVAGAGASTPLVVQGATAAIAVAGSGASTPLVYDAVLNASVAPSIYLRADQYDTSTGNWTDLSGNGRSPTKVSGSTNATKTASDAAANGAPTIQPSSTALQLASLDLSAFTQLTIVAVCRSTNSNGAFASLCEYGNVATTTKSFGAMFRRTTGVWAEAFEKGSGGNNAWATATDPAAIKSFAFFLDIGKAGSASQPNEANVFQSNAQAGASTAATNNTGNLGVSLGMVFLGRVGLTNFLAGTVCEIIVWFGTPPTSADLAAIETQHQARYGSGV